MLEIKTINLKRSKVETLVVPVCEDQDIHTDPSLTSLIGTAKAYDEFGAKQGETLTLFQPADTKIVRAIFYGLGKAATINAESLRSVAGKAASYGIKAGLSSLTIATPSAANLDIDAPALFRALMEGALLGNHVFDRYKQKKERKPLSRGGDHGHRCPEKGLW